MGLMPFARGQHKTPVDDLPADWIENHNPLVAAARRERRLFTARCLRLRIQRQHTSGIFAAIPQDGIAPGGVTRYGNILLLDRDGGCRRGSSGPLLSG